MTSAPFAFGDVYNPAPAEERQPRPNPLPKTTDPLDWECPNADCKNINFKKRSKCNRCGEAKPSTASKDPRVVKKDATAFDWWCMQCGSKNLAAYLRCTECSNVRPEERALRAQLHGGKAGGFFDRQDPEDRNKWDSDEESVDDFGRKKKKTKKVAPVPDRTGREPRQSPGTRRSPGKESRRTLEKESRQSAALARLYGKQSQRTEKSRSRSPHGKKRSPHR
eukprot:GEMP01034677.1.p2 GENE.GEMP01034677.1~~GEMP01034677.1.p2  ORF type:complete len:222 (+),score=54.52 GEMP01034677.1:334-999(+)